MKTTEEITVELTNEDIKNILTIHLAYLGKVQSVRFDQAFDGDEPSIWPGVTGVRVKMLKDK